MVMSRYRALVVGAVLLLPACSFSESALWPTLTGEDPTTQSASSSSQKKTQATSDQAAQQAQGAPSAPATPDATSVGAGSVPPQLGNGDFRPPGVTPGKDTGTFVGRKVKELRGELKRMQESIGTYNTKLQELRARMVANAQAYHRDVALINTRLQVGTTPGNPILMQKFNDAQTQLAALNGDVAAMNQLATAVSGVSTMSSYLAESTRAAFGVSGAVDEDHRQLRVLQDEVNQTVVLIERLLTEISGDIRRQSAYVSSERSNLNTLAAGIKSGEIYGASLSNVARAAEGPGPVAGKPMDTTGRRPLVVIRFDRPDVAFQQALYNAVGRVLERRPDAAFDLVAVTPSAGGPARVALNANKARRHAEDVLRALVDMGLSPARVAVSAKTDNNARSSEVRLYLR
ncbi:hypothetical protein [Varunaivibrio sulfuroxidans]|uniref:OmpA family protein n=1 Tax=Varunaivibrio sulfuroxidans TaxID=1773489 RepID=A0A4R3JHZ6_9PROT|nr:hypothetical protein [Varunaivibrio sulfuroxidans]TCS64993.1 hypothetical protein EDD55_101326 [Varunaivibrio sulfuroxidans]WES29717.1 hypothetical protein P3M64_08640 [Varunaivibrio sulfuroxidans]